VSNGKIKSNSITSGYIKNHGIKNIDLGANAVQGNTIANDSVDGNDIKEKTLGQVPSAEIASRAFVADLAGHADVADKAAVADRLSNQFPINRFTLPIGRATVAGFFDSDGPQGTGDTGDDEHSNQRKNVFKVGPVTVVADCKRTSNGDNSAPDDPFTSPGSFEEDGDEAKLLVYTDSGTVTFNSLGNSSRRNIPPGEGDSVPNDTNGNPNQENVGGEGKHMALAAARDPQTAAPERDWKTAYKFGTIYISTDGGTEVLMTAYAGIDVLGVGDNCVFGGQYTVLHA
jgi:hypothetical protein